MVSAGVSRPVVRQRRMECRAGLETSIVISSATAASLALGRFVFLPFQRDNVGRQGLGEFSQPSTPSMLPAPRPPAPSLPAQRVAQSPQEPSSRACYACRWHMPALSGEVDGIYPQSLLLQFHSDQAWWQPHTDRAGSMTACTDGSQSVSQV